MRGPSPKEIIGRGSLEKLYLQARKDYPGCVTDIKMTDYDRYFYLASTYRNFGAILVTGIEEEYPFHHEHYWINKVVSGTTLEAILPLNQSMGKISPDKDYFLVHGLRIRSVACTDCPLKTNGEHEVSLDDIRNGNTIFGVGEPVFIFFSQEKVK
jgi:hypothetical protein